MDSVICTIAYSCCSPIINGHLFDSVRPGRTHASESLNGSAEPLFSPEPDHGVRLQEHVNLAGCELETSAMEICKRLHRIEREADSEVLVGQQPIHDQTDCLL